MEESNILQTKKLMEEAEAQYQNLLNEMKIIRQNPEIIKYEKMKNKLHDLGGKYNILRAEYCALYQEECSHPLWVFISDQTDSYEQRQSLLCRCIRCGKEKTGHSREFNDIINVNKEMSYYDISGSYHEILNSNNDVQKTLLLVKKLVKNSNE
ncbi:MAG: hypothetical protein PHN42_01835 [Bacilli bacterium]|nr:hypothetical protein [Bacilli bacterium]